MALKGDYDGVGEMLRAPWMQAEMKARAEKVKARAIATAPDAPLVGEGYKFEFRVESGVKENSKGTRRAYGRVVNGSDHAIYVEYGGGRTSHAHRTLGKALDAAK